VSGRDTLVWPRTPPSAADRAAFVEAEVGPYWLSDIPGERYEPLDGDAEADLCIVGAGFTGLWAALLAKRRDPRREVVVLEAETVGHGASGRNGGFCSYSLTHGIENGLARFADEVPALERLGRRNFEDMIADLDSHGIECDLELTGDIDVALEAHEEAWLAEAADLMRRFDLDVELLDREAVQAEVASPTYRAGLWNRTGAAILDPGKLAVGLARAAVALGVRICERTPATGIDRHGDGVEVRSEGGAVRAGRAVLATSAYPPLLRSVRRYVLPVYDYVLVSEPLDAEQREAIGWRNRQGISDSANQFHYYRLTADDRVLWGGYDAVYRFGGPVGSHLDDDPEVFAGLAQRFFTTFPQLRGLRFTHRWGGAIDTCSRFSVFFGSAHGGRVAYAAGYTGLGVGASRFGASVALDLVDGRESEATRLRYVRRRPVPFPPEPLRSAVVQLTRNRLAAADRNQGRRGMWLRTLDRLGLGFDS
jgi:glycine/D-amino acid oxidase-like deaminating enzyme